MTARRTTPVAPAGPRFVERLLGTFVRWVAWCVAGAFAYAVVVIAVSVVVRRIALPADRMAALIVYNTGSAFVLASLVLAMVFMPYGFIVWGNPKLRFAGETTPWATGALRGAIAGALLGIVFGLAWHR